MLVHNIYSLATSTRTYSIEVCVENIWGTTAKANEMRNLILYHLMLCSMFEQRTMCATSVCLCITYAWRRNSHTIIIFIILRYQYEMSVGLLAIRLKEIG